MNERHYPHGAMMSTDYPSDPAAAAGVRRLAEQGSQRSGQPCAAIRSLVVGRWLAVGLLSLAVIGISGCGHEEEGRYTSVTKPPTVKVMHPETRNIVRVIGQPSFIESYEHTSIYPKLVGYIEEWNVDIGDKVKKGQTLATLFVPELVEDFGTKKAKVKLDEERVELALKVVEVATADVKAAEARLAEAKAILDKYQSEVDRWHTEVKRLDHEVKRGVVDPQILLESKNQWRSAEAARDAAKATIMKAEAELLSRQATLAKAQVDVEVARADLSVAESEEKRIGAWVGYITLSAPFDGVIVERTANTGDFVMPATGDPSAMPRTPHIAPGGNAAPVYVVDRLDVVRIFVDIPERDANYVDVGTKASVLVQAYRDEPIIGTVTRTSWALNAKSRTLRAEIDLPNPKSQLLPGMYAYAKVIIERPEAKTLPASALMHNGERTFVWRYENGTAKRAEVRTGVNDGKYVEVTNLQSSEPSKVPGELNWVPVTGSEEIIVGDTSALAEGTRVEMIPAEGQTKVAEGGPRKSDHAAKATTVASGVDATRQHSRPAVNKPRGLAKTGSHAPAGQSSTKQSPAAPAAAKPAAAAHLPQASQSSARVGRSQRWLPAHSRLTTGPVQLRTSKGEPLNTSPSFSPADPKLSNRGS